MTCYHPINLGVPKGEIRPRIVSCGRCYGCRLDYSRNWATRIMHETHFHRESSFLTLTYRDDELVFGVSQTTGNMRATLVPRHLELFWKRFRKAGHDIRYFAAGEYGDKFGRPHYHACVFGFAPEDKVIHAVENGHSIFTSCTLDDIWGHGNVYSGDVTFESASYVARYCMKKRTGKEFRYYEDEGIRPEFVRMSRRPGIGSKFFDKFRGDIFPRDEVVLRGGFKVRPPRYYSNLLEASDPVLYEAIKAKRIEAQSQNEDAFNTRRLAVKERIKKAQTKTLFRRIE